MSTKTFCERDEHGREVGVIEHNGQQFRALGASTDGIHVVAYVGKRDELKTWCGRVILDVRTEVAEDYWTEDGKAHALIFRLTKRRAIVGYSLGAGMLFRGEMVDAREWDTEAELKRLALNVCEQWRERDAEDAEEFRAQLQREDEEQAERDAEELADMAERSLEL